MKWGLLWLRSIAALFFQLLLCPYRLCCGLALENRITFMEYVLRKSLVCTSNCFINLFHLNIQHRLPNYGKSYVDHSSLCSCTFIFSFSFCDEGCLEGSLSLYNINGFLLSVSTITSVFQGGQHDSVSPLCCSGTIGELLIFYWFLFNFFCTCQICLMLLHFSVGTISSCLVMPEQVWIWQSWFWFEAELPP